MSLYTDATKKASVVEAYRMPGKFLVQVITPGHGFGYVQHNVRGDFEAAKAKADKLGAAEARRLARTARI
jgi:hypothetical protein